MLGERVERRARLEYDFTPAWEYFDLHLKKLFTGWEQWGVSIAMLTQAEVEDDADVERSEPSPETVGDEHDPNPPAWVPCDLVRYGVLPRTVWDRMDDLIEEKCRARISNGGGLQACRHRANHNSAALTFFLAGLLSPTSAFATSRRLLQTCLASRLARGATRRCPAESFVTLPVASVGRGDQSSAPIARSCDPFIV